MSEVADLEPIHDLMVRLGVLEDRIPPIMALIQEALRMRPGVHPRIEPPTEVCSGVRKNARVNAKGEILSNLGNEDAMKRLESEDDMTNEEKEVHVKKRFGVNATQNCGNVSGKKRIHLESTSTVFENGDVKKMIKEEVIMVKGKSKDFTKKFESGVVTNNMDTAKKAENEDSVRKLEIGDHVKAQETVDHLTTLTGRSSERTVEMEDATKSVQTSLNSSNLAESELVSEDGLISQDVLSIVQLVLASGLQSSDIPSQGNGKLPLTCNEDRSEESKTTAQQTTYHKIGDAMDSVHVDTCLDLKNAHEGSAESLGGNVSEAVNVSTLRDGPASAQLDHNAPTEYQHGDVMADNAAVTSHIQDGVANQKRLVENDSRDDLTKTHLTPGNEGRLMENGLLQKMVAVSSASHPLAADPADTSIVTLFLTWLMLFMLSSAFHVYDHVTAKVSPAKWKAAGAGYYKLLDKITPLS